MLKLQHVFYYSDSKMFVEEEHYVINSSTHLDTLRGELIQLSGLEGNHTAHPELNSRQRIFGPTHLL